MITRKTAANLNLNSTVHVRYRNMSTSSVFCSLNVINRLNLRPKKQKFFLMRKGTLGNLIKFDKLSGLPVFTAYLTKEMQESVPS